jgi:hypothetical protein
MVCGRPVLVRLLRSTGLDRIVTVAGTTDEAVEDAVIRSMREPSS